MGSLTAGTDDPSRCYAKTHQPFFAYLFFDSFAPWPLGVLASWRLGVLASLVSDKFNLISNF